MNILSEYFANRRTDKNYNSLLNRLTYLGSFANTATTSIGINAQITSAYTVNGVTTSSKLIWYFSSDVAAVSRGYPMALKATAANTVTVVWHTGSGGGTLATGTFYLFKVG
jgi:hypothetical protein